MVTAGLIQSPPPEPLVWNLNAYKPNDFPHVLGPPTGHRAVRLEGIVFPYHL